MQASLERLSQGIARTGLDCRPQIPDEDLSRGSFRKEWSGSAGNAELIVVDLLAERTNGEKFVAARDTAVSGHAEQALEQREEASDVFGSDALEITIAANGAVSGKLVGEWDTAGAEARSAEGAPPRPAADKSSGKIHECTSPRPATCRRVAGGANHQSCSFE
jgi:hypothetical protein